MALSLNMLRPLLLINRFLQWSSAVIVMSLTALFINLGPRGEHLKYQEVIAAMSVVFFVPAFISPFFPNVLSKFVIGIDIIFSYLWLTSFIFAAQDYDWHSCNAHAPPHRSTCSKKHTNEAFMFLAFFFTFLGIFLEVSLLWAARQENAPVREKETRAADAPAAPAATA